MAIALTNVLFPAITEHGIKLTRSQSRFLGSVCVPQFFHVTINLQQIAIHGSCEVAGHRSSIEGWVQEM
jgi:hypothetical protein